MKTNRLFLADEVTYNSKFEFFAHIDNTGFLFCDFKSKMYPTLSSDGIMYKLLSGSNNIKKFVNLDLTKTKVVELVEFTEGFKDNQIMAIFPECLSNESIINDMPVLYFADRFYDRHMSVTRPLTLNKTSFAELLHICDKETLYEIISNWVYLHEYYHQQGSLPYDKNKKIKSLSLTAGVEELRVDLNVMIFALRNSEIGLNLELYQFVLSERLFAYIGQRSKNSYDSIASEILNHYVDLEASPNQMLKIFEKLLLSIDQIEEQFRLNKSNCKTSSGFKLEEKYYEIFSFLRSEV